MEGPNHTTIARSIAEGLAELGDERGKTRFGNVDAGPQRGVEWVVADGVRLVPDEDQQQIERLGCEVHLASASPHDSSAGVDDNRAHQTSIMPI